MSNAPLVSIIIPVYNVEEYLRQCLDSVVNQTMREIQIICVNDGSTDSSLAILQEYAARDSRIEIIDKPNGGAASARNAAYPYIRGKYTYFCDSDDWLELDLCEKVYKKAEVTGAPLTIFLYQIEERQIVPIYSQYFSSCDLITMGEKLSWIDNCEVWNKFWKTHFLLDNHLFFPEDLAITEDIFICWQAAVLADHISVVPKYLYHYRDTPGSLVHSIDTNYMSIFGAFHKVCDFLKETGNYTACREIFISRKLSDLYYFYHSSSDTIKPKLKVLIRENLTEDDQIFYQSAPKTHISKDMCLFYNMVEGDTISTVNYHISQTIAPIIKTPERFVRNWIIKPIKKRLKAA